MGHRARGVLALGVGALLGACATQNATSQAMTIAGAAAVVVGASMGSDGNCYGSGEGSAAVYCSPGLSRGARRTGTGIAVAGAALAGVGYALKPKGPDRMQSLQAPPPSTSSPYRLIRPASPAPVKSCQPTESVSEGAAPDPEAPVCPTPEVTSPPPSEGLR